MRYHNSKYLQRLKILEMFETWVSESIRSGKITGEEGNEFVRNFRSGLYGYTYLEK